MNSENFQDTAEVEKVYRYSEYGIFLPGDLYALEIHVGKRNQYSIRTASLCKFELS